MRRVLVLALVCATTSAAEADGFYVTQGVGGDDVSHELGELMTSSIRVRIGVGVRRGTWAIEGWGAASFLFERAREERAGEALAVYQPLHVLVMVGIDLKYLQPITRRFDVYLRGRASRAELDTDDRGALAGYGGRGLGVGAGVQLAGKVRALGLLFWPLFFADAGPEVTVALSLDAGHDFYRLHPARAGQSTIDATLSTMTGGFAIGSDF